MTAVILVFHVMVAIALIGLVLLQQSEGGGLGMGGGSNQFMTARGTANLLTKATTILAAIFFLTSLGLVVMSGTHRGQDQSVLDRVPDEPVKEQAPTETAPKSAPSVPIQ